jgi:hypothetical protein
LVNESIYKTLVRKPEGIRQHGNLSVDGRAIIKWNLEKYSVQGLVF